MHTPSDIKSPLCKLYVLFHNDILLPETELLTPLRVDSVEGENIADGKDYCELRAHYRIWKDSSVKADYIGFFHYRRYLELNKSKLYFPSSRAKRPAPYTIKKYPDLARYSLVTASPLLDDIDVFAPIREYTGISVYKRFAEGKGQRTDDLYLVYQIISEKYPEYLPAADEYLNGTGEYYGNIFIMKRNVFNNYCEWLFDILGEFDKRVIDPFPRTNGFLGERLFGIYFTWLCASGNVRCAELPRIHFFGYDDESHNFKKQKIINLFLPAGSKQRAFIRRLVHHE